jgi:outer membrane protein, multidrug efflux system
VQSGPNYHRPVIDALPAFLYEPAEAAASVNADWWKQFDEPILNKLIVEGLENNKNIKIAAANVQQASAVVTSTRSPLFPQVNYQGAASRNRLSASGPSGAPASVPNPINEYQVLAGATWKIDLWGRIRRLTESAQSNLLATQEARRGVVLSLVAAVASDYLQLRGLDEQLAMAQRTLAGYAESANVIELKFHYGRVSQLNVDQARLHYETAAAQIPQIKSQIATLLERPVDPSRQESRHHPAR